jgi:uncharacterized hydantoinase/oxoprolinase family protein
VPIIDGDVTARGYTNAERLPAGELVYTGLVRSFVTAVVDRAPFAGHRMPLINEYFASMADVHRILGSLSDGDDRRRRHTGGRAAPGPQSYRLRMTSAQLHKLI